MSYIPKLKRDWEGRYVRLLYPMTTQGGAIFEAGQVLQVRKNHNGLELTTVMRCPECHRRNRNAIKGVSEQAVFLLPPEYKPEAEPDEIAKLQARVKELESLVSPDSLSIWKAVERVYETTYGESSGLEREEAFNELLNAWDKMLG